MKKILPPSLFLLALLLSACGRADTDGSANQAPADFIEKHLAELESLQARLEASRNTQELETAVRAYEQAEADFLAGLSREDSLRLTKNADARRRMSKAKEAAQIATTKRLEALLGADAPGAQKSKDTKKTSKPN